MRLNLLVSVHCAINVAAGISRQSKDVNRGKNSNFGLV
jgi:hypothetical protein